MDRPMQNDGGNKEQLNEVQRMEIDIQAQWDEIYRAILGNNAPLLDTLLPPVNPLNTEEKSCSHISAKIQSLVEGVLSQAVELEHIDCVKVILDKVRRKELPQTITDHDPLRIACERGNLKIVQMLIECGCGLSFRNNAFSIAFDYGYQAIMNYLVPKCDLRTSDNYEHTTLDGLIVNGYIETAKLLIHYGDTRRDQDGFSPMMLAIHHELTPLVDLLFQRLPLQEALDELMLLACHYIIRGDTQNRQKAFDLFVRGLTEGEVPENGVSHEAYEHRAEYKTVGELVSIWDDDNAMRMYSLVVSERILLRLGDVDVLLNWIDQQCHFYRNHRFFDRLLQLRIHARHVAIKHQFDQTLLCMWYSVFPDKLKGDFDVVWNKGKKIPMDWIEFRVTCVFDEEEFVYVLDIFPLLETITYMIHLVTTSSHERRSLFTLAQRAIRHDTIINSLLVDYISRFDLTFFNYNVPAYNVSPLSVMDLMIRCGAKINGIGQHRWIYGQPLHAVAAVSDVNVAKAMIELLLAHGAHADCINEMGKFPQDCTYKPALKELLSPTRKLSLKCRCAQILVSENIEYGTDLPVHLLDFIRLHS